MHSYYGDQSGSKKYISDVTKWYKDFFNRFGDVMTSLEMQESLSNMDVACGWKISRSWIIDSFIIEEHCIYDERFYKIKTKMGIEIFRTHFRDWDGDHDDLHESINEELENYYLCKRAPVFSDFFNSLKVKIDAKYIDINCYINKYPNRVSTTIYCGDSILAAYHGDNDEISDLIKKHNNQVIINERVWNKDRIIVEAWVYPRGIY